MINFISLISFFLDGILSKYIGPRSIFLPLLTVISIIIIYPYFNNNNYRYFKYIAILGILYDIVYMNLLFYNFFVFMLLGFINIFIKYLLSECLYVNIITSGILVIVYRLCNFVLYSLKGQNITFSLLFKNIYSSLILNVVYCIIIYLITEKLSKKYRIAKSK